MKRSRNRGRRQANHANRSYESNGPDVKVRGSASTVCEKYQTLARDALSAGNLINAENYLQHAEHYYRIIAAHQSNKTEQADGENGAAGATGAAGADNTESPALGKMNGEGRRAAEDNTEKDHNKSSRLGHLRRRRKTKDNGNAQAAASSSTSASADTDSDSDETSAITR